MRRTEKSIIDYALSTNNMGQKIEKMDIDDTKKWSTSSDHNWITIDIKGKIKNKKKAKVERWKKAGEKEWNNYKNILETWTDKNKVKEETQEEYKTLIEGILLAANTAIGKSNNKFKQDKEPRNIRRKIAKRKKIDQKWAKAVIENGNNKEELWHELQQVKKEIKILRENREKKLKGKWIQEIIKEGGWSNSRKFWNVIKSFKRRKENIEALKTENGRTTNRDEIKREVELYLNKLGTQQEDQPDEQQDTEISNEDTIEIMTTTIKSEEIKDMIKNTKNNKATGLDTIKSEMIKEAPDNFIERLRECFNKIRKETAIPQEWNDEKGHLLHKKKDKENLDNYRNISVGSTIGKLFTSIITNRTRHKTEEHNIFSEIHGGFRKDRSAIDNLFILTHIIEKSKIKKKPLYLCFIDLKKAFDSVWRKVIFGKNSNS